MYKGEKIAPQHENPAHDFSKAHPIISSFLTPSVLETSSLSEN